MNPEPWPRCGPGRACRASAGRGRTAAARPDRTAGPRAGLSARPPSPRYAHDRLAVLRDQVGETGQVARGGIAPARRCRSWPAWPLAAALVEGSTRSAATAPRPNAPTTARATAVRRKVFVASVKSFRSGHAGHRVPQCRQGRTRRLRRDLRSAPQRADSCVDHERVGGGEGDHDRPAPGRGCRRRASRSHRGAWRCAARWRVPARCPAPRAVAARAETLEQRARSCRRRHPGPMSRTASTRPGCASTSTSTRPPSGV